MLISPKQKQVTIPQITYFRSYSIYRILCLSPCDKNWILWLFFQSPILDFPPGRCIVLWLLSHFGYFLSCTIGSHNDSQYLISAVIFSLLWTPLPVVFRATHLEFLSFPFAFVESFSMSRKKEVRFQVIIRKAGRKENKRETRPNLQTYWVLLQLDVFYCSL